MASNMANVWTQMGYIPPRGQCNFKQSIVSPRCPCLRFMLHPLKSSSSYECDGCSHHASFHSMENKAEDEICRKWKQEAKDNADREEAAQRPKKRLRSIGYRNEVGDEISDLRLKPLLDGTTDRSRSAANARLAPRRVLRAPGAQAKSKITEITEDDEEVVDSD